MVDFLKLDFDDLVVSGLDHAAHVACFDGQLAVSAIDQDQQLNAGGAALVEQSVERVSQEASKMHLEGLEQVQWTLHTTQHLLTELNNTQHSAVTDRLSRVDADVSELKPDEKFPTPFRHADGRVAEVFTSTNRNTVLRHFQWMKDYGIDGVFVQRFGVETVGGSRFMTFDGLPSDYYLWLTGMGKRLLKGELPLAGEPPER